MIRARAIAALLFNRFMEFVIAAVFAVGLGAGVLKAALDHAGNGLPVAIAGDMPSPALLPIPELKPWPSQDRL